MNKKIVSLLILAVILTSAVNLKLIMELSKGESSLAIVTEENLDSYRQFCKNKRVMELADGDYLVICLQ